MKLDDFVKGYVAAEDKKAFCKERVQKKYVGIVDKMAYCSNILNSANMKGDMYVKNTVLQKVLYMMNLLMIYTDVEFDITGEDSKPGQIIMSAYDLLEDSGALAVFFSDDVLPSDELNRFAKILIDMEQDQDDNNNNLVEYYKTNKQASDLAINSLLDLLQEKTNEDNGIQ